MLAKRVGSPLRQTLLRRDQQLRKEVQAEMDMAGLALIAGSNRFASGFSKKPRFILRKTFTATRIEVSVAPDTRSKAGLIYRWLDKGTGKYGPKKQPYEIKPKQSNKAQLLKFQTGYSPKTAPIAKFNAGSGRATGGWRAVRKVIHPGIRPRKFSETLHKRLKPSFKQRIDNAIRRSIRRNR